MLTVVLVSLAFVILCTFLASLGNSLSTSSQLKAAGKKPLYGQNITTVAVAALGEVLVVGLVFYLIFGAFHVSQNVSTISVAFMFGYLLRNVGRYYGTIITWSVFLSIGKRKMRKQLEEENKTAL
ncbi:putative membrane bound protein [Bacillus phage vB_BmeM-Goe8]|uniref:Putative membrane bound protein n=1 Tax=Bacillus phage vB_BmeM-Goe8 TaxID=2593638 RepID=A0A516KMV7_9CAUD|nr:putative membrane bound protein [Bacillus phage vB_BmeM-Goe8]QDP42916.1 putative membrane bound protein [Bacillus phage vB_BmeM-Goe8]